MAVVLLAYSLIVKFFLHLATSGIAYLAVRQRIAISKIRFSLLVLPVVVLVEYIQYTNKVVDSVSKIVLIRDTVLALAFLSLAMFFYFFKKDLSAQFKAILFVVVIILMIVMWFFTEQYKPTGEHFFYKHILDTIAYVLGPFVIYPLVVKYLL